MKKEFDLKMIWKTALTLLAGGAAGFLLLLLVYLIPTEPMIRNARSSVDIFREEGASSQVVHGYASTTLDNYTDAWMLRNAFYNGEEPAWQKSLNVYCHGYMDGQTDNVCESMIAWLEGKEGYERISYARYWHGYLTVLKPLLYFFDYGDIRGILKFTELGIFACLCVLLERRRMTRVVPMFVAAMMCVEFYVLGMSMQFSWVFIIAGLSCIIILKRYPKIGETPGTGLFFLGIGMLTSYFDFLTYPVFTLGIPLMMLTVCMRTSKAAESIWRLPCMAVKNSLFWAIGYAGMWAQKWLLYTVFTGENLIADGIRSVILRSGRDVMGEQRGYLDAVGKNIAVISRYPYLLVCVAAVVVLFAMRKREGRLSFSGGAFAACLYIAMLPFGWYMISVNHSYIHSFMTYRGLGVTVFAVLGAVSELLNAKGSGGRDGNRKTESADGRPGQECPRRRIGDGE